MVENAKLFIYIQFRKQNRFSSYAIDLMMFMFFVYLN